MTSRDNYTPGPAKGAEVDKHGETWALVLVRELRHPPSLVWQALTDPKQISEWVPFDANRNLASAGVVELKTTGAPNAEPTECVVKRAEAPFVLEYSWGGNDIRWQLEAQNGGTRLKLWHNIDRRFIAWGAAGWHICLDVLAHWLDGSPLGRIVGADAMQFDWQRLNAEYAKAFGIESPKWPGTTPAAPDNDHK